MDYYINPKGRSEEQFLEENGIEVRNAYELRELKEADASGTLAPVVLIGNGRFKAAGIAYSPTELDAFTDPHDPRPKRYFLVEKENLTKGVTGHADVPYEW